MKLWFKFTLCAGVLTLLFVFIHKRYPTRLSFVSSHPTQFLNQFRTYLFDDSPVVSNLFVKIEKESQLALQEQRRIANKLEGKHKLLDEKFKYQQCELTYNRDKSKAKLKLKGCYNSHWGPNVTKISYKFKSKLLIFDADEFGIQAAVNRGYLNDWLLHRISDQLNLLHPHSDFISVTINEKKELYLFEEYPNNRILHRKNRPSGPIAEFNADDKWYYGKFYRDSIDHFRVKFNYAINDSLDDFLKNNLIDTNITYFDLPAWSKYYALLTLFGDYYHATDIHNLNFYLNPKSKLIEPIVYDQSFITEHYSNIDFNYIVNKAGGKLPILEKLTASERFKRLFKIELQNLIQKLPEYLKNIEHEYVDVKTINVKEDPFIDYDYSKRTIIKNAHILKSILTN